MPKGAREAFPEIAWSSVTVSQAAGPVDMIIGRDNPAWMPVPVQEEPYEQFTLMWTSLSPRYILRENEGTSWRLSGGRRPQEALWTAWESDRGSVRHC
jgi:hypothetical protein